LSSFFFFFFFFSCHGSPRAEFQSGERSSRCDSFSFWEHVNFSPKHGSKEFDLLVSIGRCKYQLSVFSIGLIFQATLGGAAADFRPIQIVDRVFKFVVALRNV
jgi:hypothetical protein